MASDVSPIDVRSKVLASNETARQALNLHAASCRETLAASTGSRDSGLRATNRFGQFVLASGNLDGSIGMRISCSHAARL